VAVEVTMANPFPPPFYSIQRPDNRLLTLRASAQGSGNEPPQTGANVLVALGNTRTGVVLRLKPPALGS